MATDTSIEEQHTTTQPVRNNELRTAWDFVEHTGRSIFLTGKAGTGKTTFLTTVVEHSRKRLIVVAPTGVAAINAGGVTIHSFFQLPFSPYVPNATIKSKFDFGREKRRIIASLDLLIIDEVSMVRSDLLDAMDSVLRRFRDHSKPFGGVQLLMIGDLQQLAPVVTAEDEQMLRPYYTTPFFFGSKALAQIDYVTIELSRVFRQQDDTFISLLNAIRDGHPDPSVLDRLNQRYQRNFIPRPEDGYIRLTTHNYRADRYNDSELQKLSTSVFNYQAHIEGTFPELSYPTSETLELKEGAQVMFVKNDPTGQQRYYNGRIGRVTRLTQSSVSVLCQGDTAPIDVEPLEWENAQYKLNEQTREIETHRIGTFRQYPLRLAWAITIHKSQGLTFERAVIDAGMSFAAGQVYVALSRCRTLEGLVLSSPIPQNAIINDNDVDAYIVRQNDDARRSIGMLPVLKQEYHRQLLLELFDFRDLLFNEEAMVRVFAEYFYRSHAQLLTRHKQALDGLQQRVADVAQKWRTLISQQSIEVLHGEEFLQRVQKSADYFATTIGELMKDTLEQTKTVKTNNKAAAKRLDQAYADLLKATRSRRYLLLKIADDGFTISGYLRYKQHAMLDALDAEMPEKKRVRIQREPKAKKEPKEKTWVVTYRLFLQGKSVADIAAERNLTVGTITQHLARYVASGDIALDRLLPREKQRAIALAVAKCAPNTNSTAIKQLCPLDVTYDDIRLYLAVKKEEWQ